MHLCLIEISNTWTKVAVSRDGGIVEVRKRLSAALDSNALRQMVSGQYAGYVCSSVVPRLTGLVRQLGLLHCLMVEAATPLGLTFDYPNPEEIGVDRLANAAGLIAYHGVPGIAIDLGTATTFEVVGRAGQFLGGCIAPGPDLLLASLHEHTAQLPETKEGEWALPSKSTREAMRAGCLAGYPAMLDSLLTQTIDSLGWNESGSTIVITGGHAQDYFQRSRYNLIHDPHLTLRGLIRAAELSFNVFCS